VQRAALELRQRGIVLAACSKNDEAMARIPFEVHREMLLKLEDFAVFKANWEEKAANIERIAAALSLGLDSMVFLDDNPCEREYVRRLIPEVAVPELPDDPALYAGTLAAAGYFEAVRFVEEDRRWPKCYRANARRQEWQARSLDLNGYLESLQMQISFQPFDDHGRGRIAQLIAKSNQFNLTAYWYSRVARDPGAAGRSELPYVASQAARSVR
jgi:FkbH-like protein